MDSGEVSFASGFDDSSGSCGSLFELSCKHRRKHCYGLLGEENDKTSPTKCVRILACVYVCVRVWVCACERVCVCAGVRA